MTNFTTYGPLYLALQNGYFREQGIDLKLVPVNSDVDVLTALVSDSTDVGGATFSAGIFNAIGRGADIRAVAASTIVEPGHGNGGVVIRPGLNATVKTVKDVKGLKFGICSLNSTCELLAETFLAKGGLTSNDVTYQVLGFADVAPALTNKAVDIAIIIEPLYTAGLGKGLFDAFVENGDIWPAGTTSSAVYFGSKFRNARKDVAQRYTVALLQGVRAWLDAFVYKGPNRKAAVDAMVQNTPIKDPALYDKLDVPSMDPKGYGKTPETIDANLAFLTRKGQVTKPLKATDIWDPSFLDYANSKLPPYKPPA